MTKITVEEDTV